MLNQAGIVQVFSATLHVGRFLRYYLDNLSLFSPEVGEMILKRHDEASVLNNEGFDSVDAPKGHFLGSVSIAIEVYQAPEFNFLKMDIKKEFLHAQDKTFTTVKSFNYAFNETAGWKQVVWSFKLKNYLTAEEYRSVVGKGYQYGDGGEINPSVRSQGFSEEISLWVDASGLDFAISLVGNYGRFPYFEVGSREYDKEKKRFCEIIPDENVLVRIHPCVKDIMTPAEMQYSKYNPSDFYQQWSTPFGYMSLMDVNGIKERENAIKPHPSEWGSFWKEWEQRRGNTG